MATSGAVSLRTRKFRQLVPLNNESNRLHFKSNRFETVLDLQQPFESLIEQIFVDCFREITNRSNYFCHRWPNTRWCAFFCEIFQRELQHKLALLVVNVLYWNERCENRWIHRLASYLYIRLNTQNTQKKKPKFCRYKNNTNRHLKLCRMLIFGLCLAKARVITTTWIGRWTSTPWLRMVWRLAIWVRLRC